MMSGRPMSPATMVAVLLAALLMRIAVPQGWMPVRAADGWRIALCDGTGPVEMPAHAGMMAAHDMHAMSQGQHHHHDAGEHPCAFSALALALAEPALPAVPVPALAPIAWLSDAARTVTVGRGLAAPPPPSTGPPVLA